MRFAPTPLWAATARNQAVGGLALRAGPVETLSSVPLSASSTSFGAASRLLLDSFERIGRDFVLQNQTGQVAGAGAPKSGSPLPYPTPGPLLA